MTRRDYQRIASALAEEREHFDEDGACRFGVEAAARALCPVFKADNERFKRERFLDACGVED